MGDPAARSQDRPPSVEAILSTLFFA